MSRSAVMVAPRGPSQPQAEAVELLRLSAAICTRDRPAQLRRALESLYVQSEPPGEILVVDNAPSSDATRALVESEFPGVRYLREPCPGLDFARNRALLAASGEVVAFLDDDAVADTGWAGALLDAFRGNPALGACTGRVEALALESEGQRLVEANGGYSRGARPLRLPADATGRLHGRRAPLVAWVVSSGSGCSLAVRRSFALGLGGFDEALDLGAALPGGGDHDMLWRVVEAGGEIAYEPSALAWHEHRQELSEAYDQIIGHQRALVSFLTKAVQRAAGRRKLEVLAFLGWRLIKPGVRLTRRLVRRDPLPAGVLLRMWWGCLRGLGAYRAAQRVAQSRRNALSNAVEK